MAKRKVVNGKARRSRPNRRRQARRLDPIASLLLDPCNSDESVPFYNGDGGYSQRFVGNYTITTGATDTALTFAFYPGGLMSSQGTAVTATTTLTNQFTTNGIIGGTFIGANANKTRCKAACVEMWSSQAPLNVTGNVAFGVISATQYQSGSATTVDGLTQILTHQTKLTSERVEVKWFPGSSDEFYNPLPVTLPSTAMPADSDDRNIIAFAASGLPSNTAYTFRVTWVCEWAPKANLAIPSSAVTGGDSQHTFRVVNEMHKAKPGWYASLKSHAAQFTELALPHVKRQVAAGIANYGPHILSTLSGLLI